VKAKYETNHEKCEDFCNTGQVLLKWKYWTVYKNCH